MFLNKVANALRPGETNLLFCELTASLKPSDSPCLVDVIVAVISVGLCEVDGVTSCAACVYEHSHKQPLHWWQFDWCLLLCVTDATLQLSLCVICCLLVTLALNLKYFQMVDNEPLCARIVPVSELTEWCGLIERLIVLIKTCTIMSTLMSRIRFESLPAVHGWNCSSLSLKEMHRLRRSMKHAWCFWHSHGCAPWIRPQGSGNSDLSCQREKVCADDLNCSNLLFKQRLSLLSLTQWRSTSQIC